LREFEQVRPLTASVWILALLLRGAVRALYATLRVTVRREAETEALLQQQGGVILVTWHGQSLIPVARCRGRGYIGLVSLSRDGDLLAEFFRKMGWRTIRGSTGRGGARAAKMAVRALTAMDRNEGSGVMLAVTPDGPRGPSRRVQPGAVFLAQKSGKPLVPVGIGVERAWQAKSWDRFLIPMPFSRVVWLYGEPIPVGPEADIHSLCHQVEDAINAVEEQATAASRDYRRAECNTERGTRIMGDKSPKSTRKQAQQKQVKTDAAQQKKDDAQAARQVVTTKTAARNEPGK
jgi:lysophospholipid acyltransferase (LPLAT)-like uncharacterized protein